MHVSRYRGAVLMVVAVLASLALPAAPAWAASDCPSGSTEYKIDNRPANGTYGDGTLTVTVSNSDEDSFSWSSNITVDSVMVKGGTSLKENPGGRSGTASSAMNPNSGKPYGISHVSFCYTSDDEDDDEEEKKEEQDCPDKNGNGKGNMKDCDEDDDDDDDEDCPDKNGNGKGNMDDCDEDDVESDREKKCPDGSKDTNGDMPGGCLTDEDGDKTCPDGSMDANGDRPGGCGGPGDETQGEVEERPALPRDSRPAPDVQGIRFRGNDGRVGAAVTAPQVRGQQETGAEALPRTGLTVLPFVLMGLGLVSAGTLLRVRSARRSR